MKHYTFFLTMLLIFFFGLPALAAPPLGLPPVPIPADNPQTPEKIALGDKLFFDKRFSTTKEVNCATCHKKEQAFTDNLAVSEGINQLTGTRNAPTVINAAYMTTQFLDGREPSLEAQSAQPFVNPVEMGLENHDPILKIVRSDPEYIDLFKKAFGKTGEHVTMKEVKQAIAAFERTIIAGDSPFDRYQYGGDETAMSESAIRGLEVFIGQGRCISCHVIEQTQALFTNNRFHNIGVAFLKLEEKEDEVIRAFLESKQKGASVDIEVLTNENTSELGRFAISDELQDMGGFKTPTLRNIDKTGPYMHDGSLQTLDDVVTFYNNGGRLVETDPLSPYLDGGIRPLKLTDQQKADLVEFMKALTSPEFAKQ
jgi:cytochrome c peroxidase